MRRSERICRLIGTPQFVSSFFSSERKRRIILTIHARLAVSTVRHAAIPAAFFFLWHSHMHIRSWCSISARRWTATVNQWINESMNHAILVSKSLFLARGSHSEREQIEKKEREKRVKVNPYPCAHFNALRIELCPPSITRIVDKVLPSRTFFPVRWYQRAYLTFQTVERSSWFPSKVQADVDILILNRLYGVVLWAIYILTHARGVIEGASKRIFGISASFFPRPHLSSHSPIYRVISETQAPCCRVWATHHWWRALRMHRPGNWCPVLCSTARSHSTKSAHRRCLT